MALLLPSVVRLDYVCMRVMDVHVYDIDLVNVVYQSTFVHDTQAWMKIIGYETAISDIWSWQQRTK